MSLKLASIFSHFHIAFIFSQVPMASLFHYRLETNIDGKLFHHFSGKHEHSAQVYWTTRYLVIHLIRQKSKKWTNTLLAQLRSP